MCIAPEPISDHMAEDYVDMALAPVEAILDVAIQHDLSDRRILEGLKCAVIFARSRLTDLADKLDDSGVAVTMRNRSWLESEITSITTGDRQ